jgi:hypothetical protein
MKLLSEGSEPTSNFTDKKPDLSDEYQQSGNTIPDATGEMQSHNPNIRNSLIIIHHNPEIFTDILELKHKKPTPQKSKTKKNV